MQDTVPPGFFVPFETFWYMIIFVGGILATGLALILVAYIVLFKWKRDPRYALGDAFLLEQAITTNAAIRDRVHRFFTAIGAQLAAKGIDAQIPTRPEVDAMMGGRSLEEITQRLEELKTTAETPIEEEAT